jgi:proline iminopeptidase
MQILFPELKPYKRHQVKVSELHELYVDEAGKLDGIPVLFVHGGPGGACDASSRRFYDPAVYRIITFDQRGCGRSTPHGELRRRELGAIRWLLGVDPESAVCTGLPTSSAGIDTSRHLSL